MSTPLDTLKSTGPMSDGRVRLEPFEPRHVEGLRQACAQDIEIWEIYPFSMLGEHFDRSLAFLDSKSDWIRFAVLDGETVVGMTNYITADRDPGVVEIGGTYIAPAVRGGPFNRAMKALMIERAFAAGYEEIEFRVDTRNGRSMRAVEKLGARRVATIEKQMTTWTGYLRDSAVFRLGREDWRASRG